MITALDTPQRGVFWSDIGRFGFTGAVPGGAGRRVDVCHYDGARKAWVRVASGTVSSAGSYSTSLPVTYAARSIVFAASLAGCPGSAADRSPSVSVQVHEATISIDRPVSTIDSLRSLSVTGHVTPARAGIRVNVDILRSDGHFRVDQQTTTDATGHFHKPMGYGRGWLNTYTTRAAYLAANRPRYVVSSAYRFTRIAVLAASTHRTTAAEVAKTYHPGCPVGPSKLTTVSLDYLGLRDKMMHRGVIVIRSDLADDVTRAFGTALSHRFPLTEMVNPNVYGGSDPRQMEADNTSGFNCRKVTGNPYAQSPHSYGTALDVNTVENPYRDVNGRWWPDNGHGYIDRSPLRTGMLSVNSYLTASLRKDHFFWGGLWNPDRDYQHFQR